MLLFKSRPLVDTWPLFLALRNLIRLHFCSGGLLDWCCLQRTFGRRCIAV